MNGSSPAIALPKFMLSILLAKSIRFHVKVAFFI